MKALHLLILVLVMILLLLGGVAHAHRVSVFAWVEGHTVHMESKFVGGKAVHGGAVKIYDMQGKLILEGKTDDQGTFMFQAPKLPAVRIVVKAGPGHQGEWRLPLEVRAETETQSVHPPEKGQVSGSDAGTGSGISAEAIQAAVENALDKKLKPVINLLRESRDTGPSLRDILGAIGYILGLMGIATYVYYRRRANEASGGSDNRS